jgi:hypothetical protein
MTGDHMGTGPRRHRATETDRTPSSVQPTAMSSRDAQGRRATALHEAGHAVATVLLFGVAPRVLTIRRAADYLGACIPPALSFDLSGHDPDRPLCLADPVIRGEVERVIVMFLAGSAAERLQWDLTSGWIEDAGSGADERQAAAMVAELETWAPHDRELLAFAEAAPAVAREISPDDSEAAGWSIRLAGESGGLYLIYLEAVARQFVTRHSAPILALADALLERSALNGEHAVSIVTAAREEHATDA